jgi:hypothetical protein
MVIIGATGTISKSLRQYLSNVLGNHDIKDLQKNSHIGHCTHTLESANVKVQNIFHGRISITCSINCKYRTAATVHTLENGFFRYIIVNILHRDYYYYYYYIDVTITYAPKILESLRTYLVHGTITTSQLKCSSGRLFSQNIWLLKLIRQQI